jgi:predicted amidohydrolase YtcJ
MWQEPELAEVIAYAARHVVKVGVHAWGDRAVRTLLDVYEQVLEEVPNVPKGALVLEHGGLSPAKERARAIKMGIPVTVQHPLRLRLTQTESCRGSPNSTESPGV